MIRVKRNLLPVILLLSILSSQAAGQTSLRPAGLRVIQGTPLEREFADMLLKYMVHQAADSTMKRLTRFDAIQSQEDFKDWQEINRTKFIELIGGLPGKPGDSASLNARVVGEIPRDGYVVRKVIFESLPKFYVTANLYVPTVGAPPFPAVLAPCGHSQNGKAYDVYQHLFIGLAKRGYVVLAYDPIGQGERVEYWDFIHQRNFLPSPDDQHAMAGIQEYLMAQDLARYFIWDGMRGIDYLTSLKEVDAQRIGVTGSSGGGTLTTYISMLDPRVKAASIVCFITSLPKKIEARANDADSDPEQDIPGLLAAGIDHTEFVGMIAPRPVLIGAATQDFFPIDGTRRTFRELQRLYAILGASERLKMVEANQRHAYSQPLREATYAWFDRWLKGAGGEPVHELAITTEKDATLECTPTGQVFTSLGGKRVYDFNRAEAGRLADRLDLERRPNASGTLATRIAERLGSQSGTIQAGSARVGETVVGDLTVEKLLLTTEPGIVVPTRVVYRKAVAIPTAGQPAAPQAALEPTRRPAVVYLRDRDGADDDPAIIGSLAQQGELLAVVDVRGFGETKSARSIAGVSYFDARNGMDADFAYDSFFLGRPLLGMRVRDARSAVRWVAKRPDVDSRHIAVVGRGWAGVVALFAAALEPQVSSIAVEGVPVSFADLAQAELYQQPASLMLPGVLRDFDLVDVLGSLAPRPLLLLNPQDVLTRKLEESQATHALRPVHDAYRSKGATSSFEVRTAPFESDVEEALEKWILAR
ncbi:MAG TPA: acetylxylan esterase [Terriglobia bacterium]|nr:acetylxylan esterase [Terriglobia bacterium]